MEDGDSAAASEADSVVLVVVAAVDEATPLTRTKEVITKTRCRAWIKRWTL